MVNYIQDKAKELTLNNEINVEGTNVTLTDTVDNGLVDVMCEGNTMVNLYDFKNRNDFHSINNKVVINGKNFKFIADGTYQNAMLKPLSAIKPNTTYTIIVNIIKNTLTDGCLIVANSNANANLHRANFDVMPNMQGRLVGTVTTKSDLSNDTRAMATFLNNTSTQGEIEVNIVVLEGDWTNKEIPPYFEGMKSVGECEDNKLEILSSKYKANFFVNSQCLKMDPNNEGLGTSTLMTDESEKYYRAIPDKNRSVSLYSRLQKSEDFESGQEHIISVMVRSQKDTYINIYQWVLFVLL
jgi:hypothetical protein